MNHQIEKTIIATPDFLMPFLNCPQVTQVTIIPVGLSGRLNIVAPANARSPGLTLQNGGRIPKVLADINGDDVRPIVYYFKGTGTQGYKIMRDGQVIVQGVLTI
jgi:hypothetical protein